MLPLLVVYLAKAKSPAGTNSLYTRLENIASSQKGFWYINFCKTVDLWTPLLWLFVCSKKIGLHIKQTRPSKGCSMEYYLFLKEVIFPNESLNLKWLLYTMIGSKSIKIANRWILPRGGVGNFFFLTNERPGIWSCDLRANERPRKKKHGKGTYK